VAETPSGRGPKAATAVTHCSPEPATLATPEKLREKGEKQIPRVAAGSGGQSKERENWDVGE
jgi:hypothetical protein